VADDADVIRCWIKKSFLLDFMYVKFFNDIMMRLGVVDGVEIR